VAHCAASVGHPTLIQTQARPAGSCRLSPKDGATV
jgi:hypothetical protein